MVVGCVVVEHEAADDGEGQCRLGLGGDVVGAGRSQQFGELGEPVVDARVAETPKTVGLGLGEGVDLIEEPKVWTSIRELVARASARPSFDGPRAVLLLELGDVAVVVDREVDQMAVTSLQELEADPGGITMHTVPEDSKRRAPRQDPSRPPDNARASKAAQSSDLSPVSTTRGGSPESPRTVPVS